MSEAVPDTPQTDVEDNSKMREAHQSASTKNPSRCLRPETPLRSPAIEHASEPGTVSHAEPTKQRCQLNC
jgi:hypothetical protein